MLYTRLQLVKPEGNLAAQAQRSSSTVVLEESSVWQQPCNQK